MLFTTHYITPLSFNGAYPPSLFTTTHLFREELTDTDSYGREFWKDNSTSVLWVRFGAHFMILGLSTFTPTGDSIVKNTIHFRL